MDAEPDVQAKSLRSRASSNAAFRGTRFRGGGGSARSAISPGCRPKGYYGPTMSLT